MQTVFPPKGWALSALFVVLSFCLQANAGLLSFTALVNGELREVALQPIDQNGVAYVSLSSLAGQIGGGYKEEPDHIQLDLASKSAWLYLNQSKVVGSGGEFNLAHSILDQNGTVLVAISDLTPLFEKGFQVDLKQDAPIPSVAPTPVQPGDQPAPALPETPTSAPVPVPADGRAVDRPIQIIVIDAGHGGADSGLEGTGKTKESVITLAIAKKLQRTLDEGGGIRTVLTRDADKAVSMLERSSAATANKGDLLISLHVGASLARAARGIQVYCWPRQATSGDCPGAAYAERSRAMGEAVAAASAESAGMDNRSVCSAPCAPLGRIGMLGLIVEIGMMTSAADEALLPTDAFQEKAAQGIAAGVRKYMAAQQGGGAR